jgi:hypothetical protein
MLPFRRAETERVFLAPPLETGDDWPPDDVDDGRPELDEIDDDWSLELDDGYWDALTPDDDYEPQPEPGDFWPDQEAA